jgi:hypothetical protein
MYCTFFSFRKKVYYVMDYDVCHVHGLAWHSIRTTYGTSYLAAALANNAIKRETKAADL